MRRLIEIRERRVHYVKETTPHGTDQFAISNLLLISLILTV